MIAEQISHYRILSKLGAGGMGEVWLAEDTRLNRKVALKLLPEEFTRQIDRVRRFEQEARAASALNHPNILTIHEIGPADGAHYIATEFIDGQTLRGCMKRARLPLPTTLDIAAQIAAALAAAHDAGIVHRDIKPENVMVRHDSIVKVLGFGLAKLTEQRPDAVESEAPTIAKVNTDPGTVVGTASYMSPEQARGQEVDARSDIFSLGVVLYEMVAGHAPFTGVNALEVISEILKSEPSPLKTHAPDAPIELQRIIHKALRKDREQRYQHVKDLLLDLKDLKALLEAEKVISQHKDQFAEAAATTQPLPQAAQAMANLARFRVRTSRRTIIVAAIIMSAVVALLWGLRSLDLLRFGSSGPKTSFSSVAVLPLKVAGSNPGDSEYLADGITEALITKLTQLPNLRVIPWVTAQKYRQPAKPLTELARDMRVEAIITGSLRKEGNRIAVTVSLIDGESGMQYWGDEFEEQFADIFGMQRRIAVGAATELKGKLTGQQEQVLSQAPTGNAEAYELYLRGKTELRKNGREPNDLAFELFSKALKLDPKLAEAYAGLGEVQSRRYEYGWVGELSSLAAAEANFQRALKLNPALGAAYSGLIIVYWQRGDSENVLRQGTKAASFGNQDTDILLARAQAYYFTLTAVEEKAVPLLRRVLEIDPLNEVAHYRLAPTLVLIGKYTEAVREAEDYLRRFGERARTNVWAGIAYHMFGDFDRAKQHYERSISLVPDDYLAYQYLGVLYDQHGQPELARQIWKRWAEGDDQKLKTFPRDTDGLASHALAMGYLGDRAALLQDEARVLHEAPNNGNLLEQLGRGQAALGETARAVELFRQALRSGCTSFYWRNWLKAEGLERLEEAPSYQEFNREFEKTVQQFKAKY